MSKVNLNILVAVCVLIMALAGPAADGATIHVPGEIPTIQEAINAAIDYDEIEVAPGTYYEAINFWGKRVRLYSSGGADVTTINGGGSDHVVKCVSGEDANTILEGFTITGGNADGAWPDNCGGGMLNMGSSPTVNDCRFSNNSAERAGGMQNYANSNPTITNCTFWNNSGRWGGGMDNFESSPTVSECTFSWNIGGSKGGGMYNYESSPTVTNCTFTSNRTGDGADGSSGGEWGESGDPGGDGAGMYNFGGSPMVTDCTFSYNITGNGGRGGEGTDPYLAIGGAGGNGGSGAGIFNNNSGGAFIRCAFQGNETGNGGNSPGDHASTRYGPSVHDIDGGSGGSGVGMYNLDSNVAVTTCMFSGNKTGNGGLGEDGEDCAGVQCSGGSAHHGGDGGLGAGMCNLGGSPVVTGCSFIGNVTGNGNDGGDGGYSLLYKGGHGGDGGDGGHGAGMYSYGSWPIVTGCSFANNLGGSGGAGGDGGDVWPWPDGDDGEDGVAGMGVMFNQSSPATVTNCIVWGVAPMEMVNVVSSPVVTYSDVKGGTGESWFGAGCIDSNPFFVDAGGGDLRLAVGSPCIDAGDNNSVPADSSDLDGDGNTAEPIPFDLDGQPRIVDGDVNTTAVVDMGVYELSGNYLVYNAGQDRAYCSIGAAIDDANDGDEIEVAPATYAGSIDFKGKGVRLYSSGGPEVTIINASGAYHAVKCVSGEDANTILEGFTITGGFAYGVSWPDYLGGGMLNYGSSPTVTNCTFTGNIAMNNGGGMSNPSNSNPTVADCTFRNNRAVWGGGMCNYYDSNPTVTDCNFSGNIATNDGGGMYNETSSPTVTNCTLSGNWAGIKGGGMCNFNYSNPNVTNCTFTGNTALDPIYGQGGGMCNWYNSSSTVTDCNFSGNIATNDGGGMYNETSSPTVTNCTLSGNWAGIKGGGMCNYESSPTVASCTFSNNSAQWGGGMYDINDSDPTVSNCTFSGNTTTVSGAGIRNYMWSSPTVTNCILWGNSPDQMDDDGFSSSAVTYSDVQGGWSGTGNIDADPCFVSGPLGDYYLSQVAAGQALNSPCVDAGSDTAANLGLDESTTRTDQVEDGGMVDMGYHYRLPEPWDLNGDWKVSFIDFGILAEQWQQEPGVPSADIVPPEGDGIVDELDLGLLADNWLAGTFNRLE